MDLHFKRIPCGMRGNWGGGIAIIVLPGLIINWPTCITIVVTI